MQLLKDHKFHDKDIEGVLIEGHNVESQTVEILIADGTQAILFSYGDALAVIEHFRVVANSIALINKHVDKDPD